MTRRPSKPTVANVRSWAEANVEDSYGCQVIVECMSEEDIASQIEEGVVFEMVEINDERYAATRF